MKCATIMKLYLYIIFLQFKLFFKILQCNTDNHSKLAAIFISFTNLNTRIMVIIINFHPPCKLILQYYISSKKKKNHLEDPI